MIDKLATWFRASGCPFGPSTWRRVVDTIPACEDPEIHLRCASTARHPHLYPRHIDPTLEWAAQLQLHLGPELPRVRKAVLADMELLREELEERTSLWFKDLKPHIQDAYRNKKCKGGIVQIPTLLHLLSLIDYPIGDLQHELTHGFNLIGKISPGVRRMATTSRRETDHDVLMLKEILNEVEAGKITGPYAAPPQWGFEASALPGRELLQPDTWPISGAASFPIIQTGSDGEPKVRRGEDRRRGHQNKTVEAHDSPTHFTLDDIVATGTKYFSGDFATHWDLDKPAPSTPTTEGTTSAASADTMKQRLDYLRSTSGVNVWGQDPESAYRQLPVRDVNNAYVLHRVGDLRLIFRHSVLLFGAVSSVWGYNRFADSLIALGRCLLLLLCGHYVDDFTGIEWDTTAEDGFLSFAKMGSIIGTTMKESKAQPPAKEHKLLGARVGFSANPAATAHIRPDPDRVKKISAEIKEATSSDYLNSDQASRLCGKLNFLNCTMFGRASGSALKPLYSRANSGSKNTSISTPIKAAFNFLLQVLQNP